MSILSDITIRELCAPSLNIKSVETIRDELEAADDFLAALRRDSTTDPLHISTHLGALRIWAEQAHAKQQYGMIYPFNPDLTREVELTVDHTELGPGLTTRVGLNRDPGGGVSHITSKIISSGTTSYGYDVTLSEMNLKLFTNQNATEIDPKRFDAAKCLVEPIIYFDYATGETFVRIPPHSYLLGVTREYFRIPRDIIIVCLGKSTYARSGIMINTTPIEPEFEGNVVMEIANPTPLPARVYLNEGIAQFLFLRGDKPCETSYKDRGGKYMGQTGLQLPIV